MASELFQFCAVSNELCAIFKDLWPCSTCLIKFKATKSTTTTTISMTNAAPINIGGHKLNYVKQPGERRKETVEIEREKVRKTGFQAPCCFSFYIAAPHFSER